MSFKVIPAVDIKNGEVVQLVGGDVEESESFGDPIEVARHWRNEGTSYLHIVDLDGAIEGEMRNISFIKEISNSLDIFIQVGGGIRDIEVAKKFFEIGVDRLIIGTAAFRRPEFLEKLIGVSGKNEEVFVSVDSKDEEIMIEGWKKGSGVNLKRGIRDISKKGVDGFLLTDIKKEGRLDGIDRDVFSLARETTDLPIIASGGISSISDLKELLEVGVDGAVVGSALYKKSFKLRDAINSLNKL